MDIIKTTEWSCNMKYCTKCERRYTDTNASHCTLCGKALIDNPNHYSPVYVVTANGFELERIKASLTDADIPFSVSQTRDDTGLQILNAAPPENSQIFVPLSFYTQTVSILLGIGALNHADEISEQDEEKLQQERSEHEEEMSPKKRFWVKLLSIILFIGILAAVVFLADWIGHFINPNFT